MKSKTTILMILILTISSVSACSFKVGNAVSQANSKTVEKENRSNESSAIVKNTTANALSGLTGTYRFKSENYNNTISVEEQGDSRLRAHLYASYEYKINGELNANVGEAKGIVTLNGDTAVFVPEETEDCKIVLKFSGKKIIVKQESKSNCGFGLNVSAEGTYTKVSDKFDFSDSDENSTSEQNPTSERIRFAPGKSSIVISGNITKGKEKVYILGVRSGQTIKVKITDGGENNDVVFYIVAPDGLRPMGDEEGGGYDSAWSGKLQKSGDYKIVVSTIESQNTPYKIFIEIR